MTSCYYMLSTQHNDFKHTRIGSSIYFKIETGSRSTFLGIDTAYITNFRFGGALIKVTGLKTLDLLLFGR